MELLQTMREAYSRPAAGSSVRLPTPWLPETYIINSPAECEEVLAIQKANDESESPIELLWIYKPSGLNRGRGLRVVKGMESLKEVVSY